MSEAFGGNRTRRGNGTALKRVVELSPLPTDANGVRARKNKHRFAHIRSGKNACSVWERNRNRSSRARSFTSTRKGCCAGSGECRKEGSGERVFEDLVFGVPLHAYDKSGAGQGDRLDLAVRRHCFDAQTRSWTIDTLRMQRIDHDFFRSSKRCQKPACGQHNAMRRTVRPVGRIPSGAVIEPARYFMNPLVQSTTERDIQLLDASTNC